MHLPREDCKRWLERAGGSVAVSTGDQDGKPVFFGLVSRIMMDETVSGSLVTVTARSEALEEDTAVRRRLFQKRGKTFGNILSADRLGMADCGLELDRELQAKPCDPMLFQAESNYAFIRRMARANGRRFWVLDNAEGNAALAAKFCLDKAAKTFDTKKILSLRCGASPGGKRLELASREYTALGRLARVPGTDGTFLITALTLTLENEQDIYRYVLEEYAEKDVPFTGFEEQPQILPAQIVDVDDPQHLGRVRLRVDEDFAEDEDNDREWLPWVTPYAGVKAGVDFRPEKDDAVQLILASGRGVAHGAVRRQALPEEARKAPEKHLGNNAGERIVWKENALELHSGDTSIILTPEKISLKLDKVSLVLDKENLQASAGGQMKLGSDSFALSAGNKADFNAVDININASKRAKIGSRVELG